MTALREGDVRGDCERTGWDSNPRYSFKYTRVPGVRLKPLGHLSLGRGIVGGWNLRRKPVGPSTVRGVSGCLLAPALLAQRARIRGARLRTGQHAREAVAHARQLVMPQVGAGRSVQAEELA